MIYPAENAMSAVNNGFCGMGESSSEPGILLCAFITIIHEVLIARGRNNSALLHRLCFRWAGICSFFNLVFALFISTVPDGFDSSPKFRAGKLCLFS